MRLLGLVKAAEGLALRMNQGELRRQLLQHGHSGRLVVHKDPALAGRKNLPAENDLRSLGIEAIFFENGLRGGRGLENTGDNRLLRSMANHIRRRLPAHQQGQSIDQDRLACPCFSGEQVESWAKNSDGMIDNGVILSTQLDKHS